MQAKLFIMKKTLFAALLFTASALCAQDKAINVGLKVAPAFSWFGISHKYSESDGVKAKCNAGISVLYNFHENFSLVTGVNINSIGGKMKSTKDAEILKQVEKSKISYKATELELPLLIQARTDQYGSMRYFMKAGFGIGAVLQARDSEKNKIQKKYYNTALTSYILGIGAEYEVARNCAIVGELRFNGGISSFTRSKNWVKDFGVKEFRSRRNFLELGLGVQF